MGAEQTLVSPSATLRTGSVETMLDLEALDHWYAAHFEELVQNYTGKCIAVVEGEVVVVADTEKDADRLTREKHLGVIPLVLYIPTEEELVCLL